MKGIFLAAIACATLVGCSTTPNQMRQDAPNETYTSKKPPREIMFCVADAWEDNSVVSTRETRKGYSVSAALSDGKLRYLADIEKENGITVTRLYRWRTIAIGGDPRFSSAASCH